MWQWFQFIRPKTLTASVVPFFAGACLAQAKGADINIGLLLSAITAALFIQIGSNLVNDAADFDKGADDEKRLGPRRAIQQGVATSRQVYAAAFASFVLALISSIPIIAHGGWVIAFIVIVSIIAACAYTAGPYPLAYCGLGDLFVLIFFGWVATAAGYWIQSGKVDMSSFVLGTQIGLLCMVLIAINNLRDIAGDERVGKRTLAVRFGKTFARFEITLALYLPFILSLYWLLQGNLYAATFPWGVFFAAIILVRKVWSQEPSQAYNQFLGLAALLHLTFGILIGIGFHLE